MPENVSGVAIGCSEPPVIEANLESVTDDIVDAGEGFSGDQTADANSANESAGGSLDAVFTGRVFSKIEIICSIGVIPQMASFEKGKLYEIAPTNRPLT